VAGPYLKHRGQEAMRWRLRVPEGRRQRVPVQHLRHRRQRANLGKKEPQRQAKMRADWQAWNVTMPATTENATV